MESLLEKTPTVPTPFQAWYETLNESEKRNVTKARRQGLLVIELSSDGNHTVRKVSA